MGKRKEIEEAGDKSDSLGNRHYVCACCGIDVVAATVTVAVSQALCKKNKDLTREAVINVPTSVSITIPFCHGCLRWRQVGVARARTTYVPTRFIKIVCVRSV